MVYKKYRCRYFYQDGHPKLPKCNQGANCPFLHPDDDGWPGVMPRSKARDHRSTVSRSRSLSCHPTLLSQEDLFLRSKFADRKHDVTLNRDPYFSSGHNRDFERAKRSGSSSDYTDRSPNRYTQKPDTLSGESGGKPDEPSFPFSIPALNSFRTNENMNENTLKPRSPPSAVLKIHPMAATMYDAPVSGVAGDPHNSIEQCTYQVSALFRELSRLMAQATQIAETQARGDKKLKAYTELSSTLAQVSASATAPVMPTLTDILLKHTQARQLAEDNVKEMAEVWTKVLNVFLGHLSEVLDQKLEGALEKIEEANSIQKGVATDPLVYFQRDWHVASLRTEHPLGYAGESRRKEENSGRREQKRRRCASDSRTVESNLTSNASSMVKIEPSVQEILNQMKAKIDQQAQSLQQLTKENKELKASIQLSGNGPQFSKIFSSPAFASTA